ncbi:MAG: hypothetical protein ACLFTP_09775 [Rhodosalinus sp.]
MDVVLKPVVLRAMTLLEAQVRGNVASIGVWALGEPLKTLKWPAAASDIVVLKLRHDSLIRKSSVRLHSKTQSFLRDAVDIQLAN